MVIHRSALLVAAWTSGAPLLLAAEEKARPLLLRLDPQNRAKVLMALLGLVLVGIGLVALTVMAGRQVLRIARTSHGPTRRYEDDWHRKPLVPGEPDDPPASESE
jgi:hypothetical protein